MIKNFRNVKASLIMGILFISLFAVFMPSSSAGIIKYNQELDFGYDSTEFQRVMPLEGIQIEIWVKYQLTGLLFQEPVARLLNSVQKAEVEIIIGETDPWVSAVVTPSNSVYCDFTTTFQQTHEQRWLDVKFTEDAPAGERVEIPITLRAKKIDLPFITVNAKIKEGIKVAFDTRFLPIVDAEAKRKFIEVTPGDVATFDIDLINQGNAETEFIFSASDVPKGWIVSYPSKALVGSKQVDGERTITLEVTPPYEFGWHDETKRITITYQGRYFAPGLEELQSDEYELILIVRNRGFSMTPFETGIIVIIIVIIIVVLLFLKKVPIFKKKTLNHNKKK